MSADVLVRRPVVHATRHARTRVEQLLPAGAVLENEVTAAMAAGRCRRVRGVGGLPVRQRRRLAGEGRKEPVAP